MENLSPLTFIIEGCSRGLRPMSLGVWAISQRHWLGYREFMGNVEGPNPTY